MIFFTCTHIQIFFFFFSKFRKGSRVRQTPEEGRRTYRLKHCGNNNKDEDNSPKTLNDKNHQASSQKFRQQKKLSHKLCTFVSSDNIFEIENGIALQILVYGVAFKKPQNETLHV